MPADESTGEERGQGEGAGADFKHLYNVLWVATIRTKQKENKGKSLPCESDRLVIRPRQRPKLAIPGHR